MLLCKLSIQALTPSTNMKRSVSDFTEAWSFWFCSALEFNIPYSGLFSSGNSFDHFKLTNTLQKIISSCTITVIVGGYTLPTGYFHHCLKYSPDKCYTIPCTVGFSPAYIVTHTRRHGPMKSLPDLQCYYKMSVSRHTSLNSFGTSTCSD